MTTLSAKGTRLNKRGLETRQTVLRTAVRCLADGGPEAASANLVAREAGVTWGTVQHQFGDTDGLWAAVLSSVLESMAERGALIPPPDPGRDLAGRLHDIVTLISEALHRPTVRAIHHLRLSLPRERDALEAAYPATAAVLVRWDRLWEDAVRGVFSDLPVDPARLRRVRALLPGAVRGIHEEQRLSSYADMDEARRGLAEALTAYLAP